MIIEHVKELRCYFPVYGSYQFENVKQVETANEGGTTIIITSNDGSVITLINTPCKIIK